MKYLINCLLIALLVGVDASAQTTVPKTAAEIAKEQVSSIVIIEQLDESGNAIGQGSGFIVTPGGSIVTNLHVIQGATALRVKLPNGDVYKTTEVVEFDEMKDIAIIRIKGFKLPVVALGDSDFVQQGEAIVAIGNPEGLPNSVSTGVVSGMRRLETHRVFQITAPISKGSSGGALFDIQGMVIGITTSIYQGGQNINFAVPINYARGMISDQVTTSLAKLPQLYSSTEVAGARASNQNSVRDAAIVPAERMNNAIGGKLGRSAEEPMFARPDEALVFFNRLVDGIGRYGVTELAEMTRIAAVAKAGETSSDVLYKIPHLSFYSGLQFTLRKSDRILSSVELMVDWSPDELKRTFGEKFKKKTENGRPVLELREKRDDNRALVIVAMLDQRGNVRSVRFAKAE